MKFLRAIEFPSARYGLDGILVLGDQAAVEAVARHDLHAGLHGALLRLQLLLLLLAGAAGEPEHADDQQQHEAEEQHGGAAASSGSGGGQRFGDDGCHADS